MITAVFNESDTARASGLWQYDYGQVLRIQGLSLRAAVEIHFALQETGSTSETRIGVTHDGVTDVPIPDSMLENGGTTQDYYIYAWVYLSDETSGETIKHIKMPVKSRPKPQAFSKPEDADLFREAIAAVNESAAEAQNAEKSAESWVHGHEDYPDRDEDNAKYYAEQAKMHVEHVSEDAKKEIDEYVEEKKELLKGEPGTQGAPGKDAITPHIGENNHWYIGEVDTGVVARGEKGNDGVTPHIGENGHWYIGEVDTGVTAQGADGYTPKKGVDYFDGADGKSAYQYAQDGGYTGSEEEFAQKLATEYPTDVQINGESIVKDGIAKIPKAGNNREGAVSARENGWFGIEYNNKNAGLSLYRTDITKQFPSRTFVGNAPLLLDQVDNVFKRAMTDGIGPAWTDTEKSGAWSRLSSIKTAMDEVAVAGAHYLLGELAELSVVLPDDALVGQEITVSWYNGDTPSTLSVAGNMLDFDYVPEANTRSEISCLWDGTYWSVIGMSQDVPVEEVITDEA